MIVQKWHNWVKQPRHDRAWHEQDMADELQELNEATSLINHWSELSDVVYTVTRGRWSGHDIAYPITRSKVAIGYIYMYPKYSSRVIFFRRAGRKAGASSTLQSVRNPRKRHKLEAIAKENSVDPELFIKICEAQLRCWPLLP